MSDIETFQSKHDAIVEQLEPLWPKTDGLLMLPPCFTHMSGMFTKFDASPGHLAAVFPVRHEYLNPFSVVQGGFLTAMLDNTLGPLSMLIGEPSMTTHINTTFMRAVTKEEPWVKVSAEVIRNGRTQVHFEAQLFDTRERMCVAATATFLRA